MLPSLNRYRWLLQLGKPLLLGYTAWQGRQQGEARFYRERRGYYLQAEQDRPLWLHAASIGEFNGILPLIETLREHQPKLPLLLTTATPSSGQLALKRLPAGVSHAYLPVDWPQAVARFFDHFKPRAGVIMETELWPNLFATADARDIPLVIVNGRLSPRTLKAPAWLRRLYAQTLGHTRAILARSEEDRLAFIALGAAADRVSTIGNLKFSAVAEQAPAPIDLGQPYVLAASTREGEEKLVVEAWCRTNQETHLLVIAPRHPQRRASIIQDLTGFGLELAVRSRGERPGAGTGIYLADTFGELTGFISGAELVFMGGSLVPKGGQNLLEPAAMGKAIVCGPHMDNFSDETRLLLENGGLQMVDNVDGLAGVFSQLLEHAGQSASLGQAARQVVEARRDMAWRYYQSLQACLSQVLVSA